MATTGRWEHFPHGADIGVRGHGPTKAAAFEQAALAMVAITTDLAKVAPSLRVAVSCRAPDDGLLLAEWLNAVLYEMVTRRMAFSRFAVAIEDDRLAGELWGEPFDRTRHEVGIEVKGATYTALAVERNAEGDWTAQCVVDV
jgi:SHS2 domain-containing protein